MTLSLADIADSDQPLSKLVNKVESGIQGEMTPKELAAMLAGGEAPDLSELPHSLLYSARGYTPKESQGKIAAYEHRAFAREAVGENPLMALPIAVGIPAYQAYKALVGARSAPSLSQVGQGLLGIGEGLLSSLRKK